MLITRVLHVMSCCCYHKGTYFQANHNDKGYGISEEAVVVATTKVRIFKQITTGRHHVGLLSELLLLPQRYVFSSKSQRAVIKPESYSRCCCYHKGTYFQANHNARPCLADHSLVVVATTKVRIFKQITTKLITDANKRCCCCYHKGTNFQANHNLCS